jgi:hypothetical protein
MWSDFRSWHELARCLTWFVKFEIRISKSETNPKSNDQISQPFLPPVLSLMLRLFEFVSNFGFRASDFRMRENF